MGEGGGEAGGAQQGDTYVSINRLEAFYFFFLSARYGCSPPLLYSSTNVIRGASLLMVCVFFLLFSLGSYVRYTRTTAALLLWRVAWARAGKNAGGVIFVTWRDALPRLPQRPSLTSFVSGYGRGIGRFITFVESKPAILYTPFFVAVYERNK